METQKKCNKCGEWKPENTYGKDRRNKDGLQGICEICRKAAKQSSRSARLSGQTLPTSITVKTCNGCKETKPVAEYFKDAGIADGHGTICKTCRNKSMQRWRDNNRDKYNSNMRRWRKENPDAAKDADLRRTHGIGLEDYRRMLAEQNNVCAKCSKPPGGVRPLVVDHCHYTGKVRALLCYKCNRDQHVLDNPLVLKQSHEYKLKHG